MGNRWGNSDRLYFWGSKITADGDCSHEIKRYLLLGRKVLTNLDSILKSRDITSKGPSSQSYGFPSSHVLLGATLGITDKMEAWPQPPLLILQAWSRDEGVRFCDSDLFFFLSSVELAGKNVKVLIVLERSMRKHNAFCSCAQRIIHKVNH